LIYRVDFGISNERSSTLKTQVEPKKNCLKSYAPHRLVPFSVDGRLILPTRPLNKVWKYVGVTWAVS
jgi:hypothetical protein